MRTEGYLFYYTRLRENLYRAARTTASTLTRRRLSQRLDQWTLSRIGGP